MKMFTISDFFLISWLQTCRRLEEREREQLSLVGRLEEQLRERSEEAAALLSRDEARRLEEEQRTLAEIREGLLLAKEARVDGEETGEEAGEETGEEALRSARERYDRFKQEQVQELSVLQEGLSQQRERLEKEVANDHAALGVLQRAHRERLVGGHMIYRCLQSQSALQSLDNWYHLNS